MTRKNNYLKNLAAQYSYEHRKISQKLTQTRKSLEEITKIMDKMDGNNKKNEEK